MTFLSCGLSVLVCVQFPLPQAGGALQAGANPVAGAPVFSAGPAGLVCSPSGLRSQRRYHTDGPGFLRQPRPPSSTPGGEMS